MRNLPHNFNKVEACVEQIVQDVGPHIVMGTPLGLGKPAQLINALYKRVKSDSSLSLKIITALSLELPQAKSDLEKRFLDPFVDRVFSGYVSLDYMKDLRNNSLPENIELFEFYVKSGSLLGLEYAQQHYTSTNYTHVPCSLKDHGINVLVQMVAKREEQGVVEYSLSCNPEITLELFPKNKKENSQNKKILLIGQVHEQLPFMLNDALVEPEYFDMIVDNSDYSTRLFSVPDMPVSRTEYLIALHVSCLIPDGGTLQLGISSLCDAIVYACTFREKNNLEYKAVLSDLGVLEKFSKIIETSGDLDHFYEGLYANSEMFVDGFLDLISSGIVKRKVYDHLGLQELLNKKKITEKVTVDSLKILEEHEIISNPLTKTDSDFLLKYGVIMCDMTSRRLEDISVDDLGKKLKNGIFLHGGFLLGPQFFYDRLNVLDPEVMDAINMTKISYTNSLYGQEELKRAQRTKARFINTIFSATLLGAATSDALENGQVISGVGGQYNFVAQAHELVGARSILILKATYTKNGVTVSNIRWQYGHITVPRHLRDIFITEYGIADVKGKSDEEVIKAMLNITDSRFQEELLDQAKEAGKISKNYRIPQPFKTNLPEYFKPIFATYQRDDVFPRFPFGSDFTEEEIVLAQCLKALKKKNLHKAVLLPMIIKGLFSSTKGVELYLKRMRFDQVSGIKNTIHRALLIAELREELHI